MPGARLRIYGATPEGDEEYHAECVALAADLGLDGSAVFEGRVESVVDAYHSGHVVVLSSISEGFPYAVIEAMACGRPTVATDVGGVSEAVVDAGLLVGPRDDVAMAEVCVKLLRNSAVRRRLGVLSRERALEHFTLERCLAGYREFYATLTSPPPAPAAPEAPEADVRDAVRGAVAPASTSRAGLGGPPRGVPVAPRRGVVVIEPVATHLDGEQDRFDAELGALLAEFRVEASQPSPTTVDLEAVVSSALDPLEIAASLEAVGAGGWAVAGRFDRADVFGLASLLHERVPFVPGRARSDDHLARPGSTVDLLRGAIFAVPGIVFTAAAPGRRAPPRLVVPAPRAHDRLVGRPGRGVALLGAAWAGRRLR